MENIRDIGLAIIAVAIAAGFALFIIYVVIPQGKRSASLRARGLCTGCEAKLAPERKDPLCGECRAEMATAP
jgi:hypothetical protein